MSRPKQATLRALLTLALAFLPVFSGISSGLHMVLVRHVVCSTHGELVHASAPCEADRGASDPCADTPHALQEEVEPTSAALGASDPLELPADEHCLIVVLSRTCFVSWETRGAHFELPRAGQILATERREAPALSIEPIALAPKQSPPV
jgi:hypothetical protein